MTHHHHHGHHHPPNRPALSLLLLSVWQRLAVSAAGITVVWALVIWAMR